MTAYATVSHAFTSAKPSNFELSRLASRTPRSDIFACMAAGFARRRIGFAAATEGARHALGHAPSVMPKMKEPLSRGTTERF